MRRSALLSKQVLKTKKDIENLSAPQKVANYKCKDENIIDALLGYHDPLSK